MKTIERHRYKDKEIFQTRTLTYNPYPMTEIESVMGSIASNLKPEMVTKKYREENKSILCLVTAIILHKPCSISWTRMSLSRELQLIIMTAHTGGLLTPPPIRCMISLLTNTTMLVRLLHTHLGKRKIGTDGSKDHTRGH